MLAERWVETRDPRRSERRKPGRPTTFLQELLRGALIDVSGGGALQAILGNLVVQALAGNAQSPGDPGLVPAAFIESVEKHQSLTLVDDLVEALSQWDSQQEMVGILLDALTKTGRGGAHSVEERGEILAGDFLILRGEKHLPQNVPELPDVAGPAVFDQPTRGAGAELPGDALIPADSAEEMFDQEGNIPPPLAQGGTSMLITFRR